MNATRLLGRALVLLVAVIASGRAATPGAVHSLTNNSIRELAASGDTLWLATASGVNYAIDTADTNVHWWGLETRTQPWSIAAGEGLALTSLSASAAVDQSSSTFWLYRLAGDSAWSRTLVWAHRGDTAEHAIVCYEALHSRGWWWMACNDAGLVKWNGMGDTARVLLPGRQAAFSLAALPVSAAPRTSRDTARALSVQTAPAGGDSLTLWVATPGRIWKLTATGGDTLWDSLTTTIADPALRLVEFAAVHVNNRTHPRRVYATIAVQRDNRDTTSCLFAYEAGVWQHVFGRDLERGRQVLSVSLALDSFVYVTDGSMLYLVQQRGGSYAAIGGRELTDRMQRATDDVDYSRLAISDVLCAPTGDSSVSLWVATSEGFFFAHHVNPAVLSTTRFHFDKRSPKVKPDLAESYAYPGILSGDSTTARFAYNLGADAHVTIRIYDYNMDLVRTVMDGVQRRAGASRASQRSSEPTDSWDGRNESGRVVAPGVYYYKITTDKGGRAFGKIVVALSR